MNTGLGQELHDEFVRGESREELKSIDLLLSVTGAQADGNGYSAGSVAVIEQPREIAWGLPNQGSTEELSDAQAADILIHEVGHSLGIGHANEQCTDPRLSHRDRTSNELNYFEACTLEIIKTKVKPRLLKGERRRISEATTCQ